jgi:hypothetical protein
VVVFSTVDMANLVRTPIAEMGTVVVCSASIRIYPGEGKQRKKETV